MKERRAARLIMEFVRRFLPGLRAPSKAFPAGSVSADWPEPVARLYGVARAAGTDSNNAIARYNQYLDGKYGSAK